MINPNDPATPVVITTTDDSGHQIQTITGGFTKGEVVKYLFMAAIVETENYHGPHEVAVKAAALAEAYFG